VEITAAVAADLEALTQALQDPGVEQVDLEELLSGLARDTRLAVPSYRGISLLVATPVGDFFVTAMEDDVAADEIVTSLHLPLDESGGTVTFYAGRADAFVDLAADLSQILRLPAGRVVLDHLATRVMPIGDATGLAALAIVNQGVGVLIERGFSAQDALRELRNRAWRREASVSDIAAELLAAKRRESGSYDG
jgi:hypothetical protein